MDAPPTVLFDSYAQDFEHIISSVREKLDGEGTSGIGEARKAALRKVELELDEADDIISQLETEIQGIPKSIQPSYTTRLKTLKAQLSQYRKLSKDAHAGAARGELLGGKKGFKAGATSDDPYDSQRTRLLAGHESLADGSRRLADSTSLALQTEAHGAEILNTLRGQREQIEGARDMLGTAERNIDKSSKTIGGMIRQMYKQRVILGLIIAFFVVLICVILYFKIVRF